MNKQSHTDPPGELPAELQASVEQHLSRFRASASPEIQAWLDKQLADDEFSRQLFRVWSGSEFVALNCIRHPEIFQRLVDSGDLYTHYEPTTLVARCLETCREEASNKPDRETQLHIQLRYFRRYEMLRILWRDLASVEAGRDGGNNAAKMIETTRDMSRLADAVIQVSLAKLHNWLSETWGRPMGANGGSEQHMQVLAMGKLGADELNVSSDIDLIFAYPEVGQTEGGKKALGNQEFFIKLAQNLIQALDNQTAEGQVFRVDMRLRPYGGSGALVLSCDALEEYYQTQGRDWERYAMIKSRVIDSGQADDGGASAKALMQVLRAFTYRRYTDFSAIQSLRDMKAMINHEVKRRGLFHDIKLGHGGIREIEFIAQAFQLIKGGRDQRFQSRRLRDILALLDEEVLLPERGGQRLWRAYVFLRNLEHVLQGWRDQQTQALPDSDHDSDIDCLRVATMMGFAGWEEFFSVLDQHRGLVSELFQNLVQETETDLSLESSQGRSLDTSNVDLPNAQGKAAWLEADLADLQFELDQAGFDNAPLAAERLDTLRTSQKVSGMAADSRARLDQVMPAMIAACGQLANSTQTLIRVLALVEAVARRSAYLVLLIENPLALKQLVTLCAASPWISQSLSRHPVLLDELLDARALYTPLDRQRLQDELLQQLLRIPESDLEAQMDALRYFRLAHALRVAACEVMEVLPLMEVSDHLTCLAEIILEQVLTLAWQQLTEKYGQPGSHSEDNSELGSRDFLIVAYGKLGGIELSHGSDLDLVFLHNADANLMTTGGQSIANETFFVRLGQRIIHILNTAAASGVLYEVDMRLRPSGNSGLLVSSMAAFEKYQRNSAWTWEHQALVRARPLAGDPELADHFLTLRHNILIRERALETLKREVVEMRQKMAEHLGLDAKQKQAGQFDLKQDPGGIVDIEFMVQFAVLAQAHAFPQLTQWSDNIRILGLLSESEVLTADENQELTDAYIAYRSAGHRLQLQQEPNVVEAESFDGHRGAVLALWQKLFS